MDAILNLIQDHQILAGMVLAILLSNAVRALPEPLPMDSRFYLWFYRFTHGVLANWERLRRPNGNGRCGK